MIDTSAPRKLRQYKDSKLIEEIAQIHKDESMMSKSFPLLKTRDEFKYSSDASLDGHDFSLDQKVRKNSTELIKNIR